MDPSLNEINTKIQSTLDHLKRELATIRAGRANPSLVEEIQVNAYGGRMKMLEVGTITAPQPSLLTIQVWDASIVHEVEKAIMEAKLGITPSAEGNVVRLPIPPLTEERRDEFSKLAHSKGEEARVSVRQARQDSREMWQLEKEEGEIGEDEFFRREKLLQEQVDKANVSVDELVKAKVEELHVI